MVSNTYKFHTSTKFEKPGIFQTRPKGKQLINYIFMLAKYYIYKTKFFTHNLDIENFITYLKRKFHIEKYISIINNKIDKFMGKWSTLYQFFQGTNTQCANHFDHLGFIPKIATNHTVNLARSHTDT